MILQPSLEICYLIEDGVAILPSPAHCLLPLVAYLLDVEALLEEHDGALGAVIEFLFRIAFTDDKVLGLRRNWCTFLPSWFAQQNADS